MTRAGIRFARKGPKGDEGMRLSTRVAIAICIGSVGPALAGGEPPRHNAPPSLTGNLVVSLCDGETSMEVQGVKPGEPLTHARAQEVADALMNEWRRKHPDRSGF